MNNQYSNNTVTINPKTYLKTLSLIHIALMSGNIDFWACSYMKPQKRIYIFHFQMIFYF